MTIIVTHLNRFGIVHAADTNLTIKVGTNITYREAQKLFQIPSLNAAVTVAGNALLGVEDMEDWMPQFIETEEQHGTNSLRVFSEHLRDAWFNAMNPNQRTIGNWAHIAGYVTEGERSHPECWFVSNILRQELNDFAVDSTKFHRWEDFATRDCRVRGDLLAEFTAGNSAAYCTYLNGYPTGRILMNLFRVLRSAPSQVNPILQRFVIMPSALANSVVFEDATDDQVAQFTALMNPLIGRTPTSIEDTEDIVRASIDVISRFFEIGGVPVIGGPTSVFRIPAPNNCAHSSDELPLYNGLTN